MSETYDEIIFLPSAENQVQLLYDRVLEERPGPLQAPEYTVSSTEGLSEFQDILSETEGNVEFRKYHGDDYEVVESFQDVDIAQYVDEKLSLQHTPEEEQLLVENVGSFDLDLRDGDFFTGYVLTGRKYIPDEIPKPMMAEIQVFADPRKDSSAVIKVQED